MTIGWEFSLWSGKDLRYGYCSNVVIEEGLWINYISVFFLGSQYYVKSSETDQWCRWGKNIFGYTHIDSRQIIVSRFVFFFSVSLAVYIVEGEKC